MLEVASTEEEFQQENLSGKQTEIRKTEKM